MAGIQMADDRWTTNPDIDVFLETLEIPSEEMKQQYLAARMPLEEAAPKVGDKAPDFSVELLGSDGQLANEHLTLKDYAGRNLVLQFGSYTCPVYRGQIGRFNEIYAELGCRMEFLLIYISEEHPVDGWELDINRNQNIAYKQPAVLTERAAIAAEFVHRHNMKFPVALDDMGNTAGSRYSAAPERLYIIDGDGVIRYRSAMGPFKLAEVEAWYTALKQLS
jgi:alkyl hydroperoxide reductase subunit AhpC